MISVPSPCHVAYPPASGATSGIPIPVLPLEVNFTFHRPTIPARSESSSQLRLARNHYKRRKSEVAVGLPGFLLWAGGHCRCFGRRVTAARIGHYRWTLGGWGLRAGRRTPAWCNL